MGTARSKERTSTADGSADFAEIESTIVAELEQKQGHYRTKAWRTPLLWMAIGAVVGVARHVLLLGLIVGAVVGTLWAIYFLWQSTKDPRRAPILDLLRTRSHDIVWIYARPERREESAVLVLGLLDGAREEVPVVGDAARLQWMVSVLAARAPWAAVGFHHEHERRFFENPASLRDARQQDAD